MKSKLTDELITALLEVMNIPKSGYIEASLREKLAPLNPKHYTEVMMNLMDNQDRYAKPIEKVSSAIQKSLDRYCHPKTVDELLSLFKRAYRGRVITDDCAGFNKGVKIAVSADGERRLNVELNSEKQKWAEFNKSYMPETALPRVPEIEAVYLKG